MKKKKRSSKVKKCCEKKEIKQDNKPSVDLNQMMFQKSFRISADDYKIDGLENSKYDSALKTQNPIRRSFWEDPKAQSLMSSMSQMATGLWRARKKYLGDESLRDADNFKGVRRHIDFAWEGLSGADITVKDYDHEKYVPGMALKVLTFQPVADLKEEIITETIKPSVFYKDQLIQRGEIIVSVPQESSKNS